MIATSTEFWKAFFDPSHPKHKKARDDLKIYDKEKIILSQPVVLEIVSWLLENGKTKQKNWFLDYVLNTANIRLYHFGKEEFEKLSEICIEEEQVPSKASLEYLKKYLNCDIVEY